MIRQHLTIGLLATTALCAPAAAQQAPLAPADDAEYRENWGLGAIDALAANKLGFTGKGVVVAVVDNGMDVEHPEFAGRISDDRLTYAKGAKPRDVSHATDRDGNVVSAHGTHVAGIIGAARDGVDRPGNMQGVAYEATLLPIQAIGIESDLPASKSATSEAIRHAAKSGAAVLNGSYGPNTLSKTIVEDGKEVPNPNYQELDYQPIFDSVGALARTADAIEYAAKKDVVLVFSAGNEESDQPIASAIPDGDGALPLITPETIRSGQFRLISNNDGSSGFNIDDPSTWEFVDPSDPVVDTLDFSDLKGSMITVVAVTKDNAIADYSNRCGPAAEWCIAAPGGDYSANERLIISTWQVKADGGADPLYKGDAGTSMAAPHVSGAAALVRQAFPYMNARQTIETILTTATDIGDAATFGQGLLNVGAAVKGPMAFRYDGVFDVDTRGQDSVWSNDISGSGDLVKRGSGTLTLSGDNTFTGRATVVGGTLAVDGSVAATTRANSGGRLAGSGTVGRVFVGEGGTIAPGGDATDRTATLSVDGDLVQRAGSVYRAGVAGEGISDQLAVSGAVRIEEGATLSLVEESADALALGARYRLLTAEGGVTGSYASIAGIAEDAPLVDFALVSRATSLDLDVKRSDLAFASLARTSAQRSVARAVESQGAGGDLFDSVVFLTAEQAGDAFEALSGEIYASARSVLTEDAAFLRGAVTDRLRAAFGGVAAPAGAVMAFAPTGGYAAAPDAAGLVAWGRAFGAWGRLDGGEAADVDTSTGGFFAGADAPVGDVWRVGAIAGYSRVSFDADSVSSSGSSDNTQFGLYAGAQWGKIGFRAGASYAWNSVDADRTVAYDDFSDRLSSGFDGRTGQIFGELGYRADTEAMALEPYANLAYVHLSTDGFDESGGAAALSGGDASSDTAFSTLGVRLAKALDMGGAAGTLRADLGWRYAFGDVTPEMSLALADGTGFDSRGAPIARNAALIGAGLDMAVNARTTVGFSYQGQFASDAQTNAITGTLTVRF